VLGVGADALVQAGYGFALSLTRGLRLEGELRMGTALPMLYHVGDQPFTYSVFLSGGTMVVGRKPEPGLTSEMILEERVTAWLDAVMSARPELDTRCLAVIVYGWAALAPSVLTSVNQHSGDGDAVHDVGRSRNMACI
jgi:hypothetical protein